MTPETKLRLRAINAHMKDRNVERFMGVQQYELTNFIENNFNIPESFSFDTIREVTDFVVSYINQLNNFQLVRLIAQIDALRMMGE